MKYVSTEAIAQLFGKVLPFSVEYFANHIEHTLITLEGGRVRPEFAGASSILLANNRANKQGTWDLYKDFDLDIYSNYVQNSSTGGGSLETSLLVESKTNSKMDKLNWSVIYRLRVGDQFNGTPWEIEFPLQMIMKYYPHNATGPYFGYCHSIALMDEKNRVKDQYFYVGITRRSWLTRMAEHFREINSGSDKTFHKEWRDHVGRKDVILTSELVVDNHTFDEIMRWEEDLVDRNLNTGKSLNMIPGGFKGMRYLHEHRLTHAPVVSLKERDRAVKEYQKQNPRKGIPNLLISELWNDPDWAAKAICSQTNRLSKDQVLAIRVLGAEGISPGEIIERVGARNELQVKRVLDGDTYKIVT
jgi:hypothetical protein